MVACLRLTDDGPAILLSGHLEGDQPILIHRVADYHATVAALREAGTDVRELEELAARSVLGHDLAQRRGEAAQVARLAEPRERLEVHRDVVRIRELAREAMKL